MESVKFNLKMAIIMKVYIYILLGYFNKDQM